MNHQTHHNTRLVWYRKKRNDAFADLIPDPSRFLSIKNSLRLPHFPSPGYSRYHRLLNAPVREVPRPGKRGGRGDHDKSALRRGRDHVPGTRCVSQIIDSTFVLTIIRPYLLRPHHERLTLFLGKTLKVLGNHLDPHRVLRGARLGHRGVHRTHPDLRLVRRSIPARVQPREVRQRPDAASRGGDGSGVERSPVRSVCCREYGWTGR